MLELQPRPQHRFAALCFQRRLSANFFIFAYFPDPSVGLLFKDTALRSYIYILIFQLLCRKLPHKIYASPLIVLLIKFLNHLKNHILAAEKEKQHLDTRQKNYKQKQ